MTDWFQSLMSGFGRAVQIAGANQSRQEKQAEQSASSGASLSGTEGVAALLGNVAANLGSTTTLKRPETISGAFTDEVPDTAFIVLHDNVLHTPPVGPVVPAIVARLVPGRVFNDGAELAWTNPQYWQNVPVVYWVGGAYQFLPSNTGIPTTTSAAERQRIVNMNQIAPACRSLYRTGTSTVQLNLQANAASSGHYFVDLVFTQQAGQWRPTQNPNAPVVRQPLLQPGRRLLTTNPNDATSSLGNIYQEYATALKVTVQWPMVAGTQQNSWVAMPGAVTVTNDSIAAYAPSSAYSGMLLQPGFVAGLFEDRTGMVSPELVAWPGFVRPASRLFTDLAANPLHLDLEGLVPAGTPANPLALVNRIVVPPALAINPTQPATLIVSRIVRSVEGAWLAGAQDGTFPIGGGTLSVVLRPTTVFADAVRATVRNDGTPTTLTASRDHYLGVATATGAWSPIVAQGVGAAAPSPPAGVVWVSRTTTDPSGVIASVQLLPNTMPVRSAPWIESFALALGNLRRGEMNRVSVQITQAITPPNPGTWQAAISLNDAAPVAVAVTPTQVQIA